MIRKIRNYSGTLSTEITERELRNRSIARKAAAEGMVLLHNDGVLPLSTEKPIALFGSGSLHMVKGGTGSGDVNEREVVSIAQGLRNAGFLLENEQWLTDYETDYQQARQDWKRRILDASAEADNPWALIDVYVSTPRKEPVGRFLTAEEEAGKQADTAIYILSRIAGEGADRHAEAGDYYLTQDEQSFLTYLRKHFANLIVVLNCGGQVDLNFIDQLPVNGLLLISQPGMEGGNAFADIISGKVTPSGHVTDTWAYNYEDFPGANTFGHRNGNIDTEVYAEGIYMGYRYFDTFGVKPRISFGYGLSYTTFDTTFSKISVQGTQITMCFHVTNTGAVYAGKEVVQIYAACPQTKLPKERRRLCAFGKTPLLQPGESCEMTISFCAELLTSFDESQQAYVLEQGNYVLCAGSNAEDNVPVAVVHLPETCKTKVVDAICPLEAPLEELVAPAIAPFCTDGLAVAELDPATIITNVVAYDDRYIAAASQDARDLVSTMTPEQLISLTSGDPRKGQDSSETFGSSGLSVPGSAGETHNCASAAPWNLASIVLADGPAGLRLSSDYSVRPDGSIVKPSFIDSIERGFFSTIVPSPDDTVYHQYCTAIPVGTLLAQTWDPQLLQEIGATVAVEMEEFGVTLWLAPGMNLHRNPLCGRNFEYYSEDPVLTGIMAASITKGVQNAVCGVGTTIKHFACNGVEDNRKGNNSVLSQRALRELYLLGFEIAVRSAQPMALMTSYNLINGVHTANSFDLVTKVLRNEWSFDGIVMTDWTTTGEGGSCPATCVSSGHNLIMPGSFEDLQIIRNAANGISSKVLTWDNVKESVAGLVQIIRQSLEYEDAKPYGSKYQNLPVFVKSSHA